jgi:hypothetical protein
LDAAPATRKSRSKGPAAGLKSEAKAGGRFLDGAMPAIVAKGITSAGQLYLFFQVSMPINAEICSAQDFHYLGKADTDVLPRMTGRNSG